MNDDLPALPEPDLRGIDAGDLHDWCSMWRRGHASATRQLVQVSDINRAARPAIEAAFAAGRAEVAKWQQGMRDMEADHKREVASLRADVKALTCAADKLRALLWRMEPHIDSLICYASTTSEHAPNQLALDVRTALGAPAPVGLPAGEQTGPVAGAPAIHDAAHAEAAIKGVA